MALMNSSGALTTTELVVSSATAITRDAAWRASLVGAALAAACWLPPRPPKNGNPWLGCCLLCLVASASKSWVMTSASSLASA